MSDLKEMFEQVVSDQPAATSIGPGAAIAAGRRAFRRRRSMQVAGALAATTGLAFGGVWAVGPGQLGNSGQPSTSVQAGATESSSAAASTTGCPAGDTMEPGGFCVPTAIPPRPTERPAAAKKRLTGLLKASVQRTIPKSKVDRHDGWGGQLALEFEGDLSGYKTGALVTTGSNTGSIYVSLSTRIAEAEIGIPMKVDASEGADAPSSGPAAEDGNGPKRASPSPGPPHVRCSPSQYPPMKVTYCKAFAGPRGEVIEASTSKEGQKVMHSVNVTHRDGTTVHAGADNTIGANGDVRAAVPPVTLDELREIVLAEGLTLYP